MTETILALHTNLFPDRETVEASLRKLEASREVRHFTVMPETMDDAAWDKTLAEIMSVEKVITL